MASFNRVILMGNLTRDPQLKYLANSTAVCEFGLAVNHRWRDKEGNQREEVCFVDCALFGRSGEVVNQYMTKGKPILVEGRLRLETWTAQDGTKRSKHTVWVDNFTFVGGREQGGGGAPAEGAAGQYAPQRPAPPRPAGAGAPRSGYGAPQQAAPPPAGGYDEPTDYPPVEEEPPPTGERIPF